MSRREKIFRTLSIPVIIAGVLVYCSTAPQEAPSFIEEEFRLTMPDGIRLDCSLFFPRTAPPSGGFPLVIPVHGGGGNKTRVYAWRDTLIAHGYAVFAFSVRGQGKSEGVQNVEGVYRIKDLQFLTDWLQQEGKTRGTWNPAAMGMMGRSQGGQHGWMAACFNMPLRTAILSNASTSPLIFNNCMGRIWTRSYQNPNTRADAARDTIVQWMRARDFPALRKRPRMKFIEENIHRITMPVFLETAWLDQAFWGNLYLEHYDHITAPKKLYLGTGGHGSESVESVWDWRLAQNIRWFDYWLKGIDNGIMDEPPIAYAEDAHWEVRYTTAFPPPGTTTMTWYMHDGTRLHTDPPAAPAADTIRQIRTDPHYSYHDYFPREQAIKPADAFRVEPLFLATDPFQEQVEFTGIPHVTLVSESSAHQYQTHVRFYDIDHNGNRCFITRANFAVLHNRSGTINTHTWEGFAISHIFQPGHRLGVEITPVDFLDNGDTFVIPLFDDYQVTIHSQLTTATTITLPIVQ